MSDTATITPPRRSLVSLRRSFPELVSTLISDEIRTARLELIAKLKAAAVCAGLLVAGVVLGLFTFGVLIATAILGPANVKPAWLSSLIVVGSLLIVGSRRSPPVEEERSASAATDHRQREEGRGHNQTNELAHTATAMPEKSAGEQTFQLGAERLQDAVGALLDESRRRAAPMHIIQLAAGPLRRRSKVIAGSPAASAVVVTGTALFIYPAKRRG